MQVLLIIATCLLASTKVLAQGRFAKNMTKTPSDALFFNGMIFCTGAVILLPLFGFNVSASGLIAGIVAGIFNVIFQMGYVFAFSCGPVSLTTMIATSSMVITIVMSAAVYGESLSVVRIIGIALVLVALYFSADKIQKNSIRLKWALFVTKDSESTQKMLWTKCTTGSEITKTLRHYNNEVCPDGNCEIFEYRAKKQPKTDRVLYPYIMAGLECGIANSHYEETYKMHYVSPVFTVGGDFYLKRFSKGLFFDVNLSIRHYEDEYYLSKYYIQYDKDEYFETEEKNYYEDKCTDFTFFYGFGYQWKQYQCQPRIYGGSNISYDTQKELGDGILLGTGFAYPMSHGSLLLDLNCSIMHYDIGPDILVGFVGTYKDNVKKKHFSVSLGYQF